MSKFLSFGLCMCGSIALATMGLQFASAAENKTPSATQQLKKANEGAAARDHVFDGRKAPPPAVTANPAQKPSMVGKPVSDFKPVVRVTPAKAPPPPPRNLNPTGDKAVQKGIDNYKKPGSK